MKLTSLELEEFRCYRKLAIQIPPDGLRIYGQNASGKTSLLEAVYLLATVRSPRASLERETINWHSGEEYMVAPYARVRGEVASNGSHTDIEIVISVDESRGTAARKRVKLDGRARRAIDVVGTLKVVLFAPEDLNLVLGSPSVRRRYLDISISQLDRTYLKALSRFGRILEQRNSLLKELGARRVDSRMANEELTYWDGDLVTRGAYIVASRIRYLARLQLDAAQEFEGLARTDAPLLLRYAGTISLPDAQVERIVGASMTDAQALVGRAYEADLLRRREDELRRGTTLTGPHRDDLAFVLGGRDLSAFGSRGQQRLVVVATKLAELRQVLARTEERPVLLLDDVLSELDPEHQERLLGTLGQADCQILVTATDRSLLDQDTIAALPFVETVNGELRWED